MEIYTASERDMIPIPIVGNVAAGYQAYAATDIVGYELVESSIINDGFEYAWLKVKGDSMSPLILENDLVLVRLQDEVESGDLAVVIVDEEDGVIKRVQFGMNKVTLISENSEKYPPRVFTGKESSHIRIWGKAIDLKRKLV
jgi:repressor LexA